jgi:hypothetical protein
MYCYPKPATGSKNSQKKIGHVSHNLRYFEFCFNVIQQQYTSKSLVSCVGCHYDFPIGLVLLSMTHATSSMVKHVVYRM